MRLRTSILLMMLFLPQFVLGQISTVTNPHGTFSSSISCASCHSSEAWKPALENPSFDHSKDAKFALIGRHNDISCKSCHFDLKFDEPTIVGEGCQQCHVDVHQGAFSQACTDCHDQMSFKNIDGLWLHQKTAFPLTGSHQQIACQSCHNDQAAGHFTTLSSTCYDCHQKDYELAESIDHVEADYSTDCEQCHTTIAWAPAFFDHVTASGGFRLLGAHNQTQCSSCHHQPSMDLKFTVSSDTDCYGCHFADYADEHGGSGFPKDCQQCHTTSAWEPTHFDHFASSGGFQLLGAHEKIDCSSCHNQPSFDIKFSASGDTDCYACHTSDYAKEHSNNNFPLDCQLCHSVDNWDGKNLTSHDSQYFPIYSGEHRGEWNNNCQSCHMAAPNSFMGFSCIDCHEHNKSSMDREHREESGYVYNSANCYSCHPDGRADDD